MAETRFTPGPWHIVEYGDGDSLAIHHSDTDRVCFMATHGGSQKVWQAIQANARLITAAPDLYEALAMQEHAENENANCPDCEGEGDWSYCGRCSELFGPAIDARIVALAKARGEQP